MQSQRCEAQGRNIVKGEHFFHIPYEKAELIVYEKISSDIETDGLDAKKSLRSSTEGRREPTLYTTSIESDTLKQPTFLFHNGVSFDAPVLKRLLNNIPLTRYVILYPVGWKPMREGGHSLEAWGKSWGIR